MKNQVFLYESLIQIGLLGAALAFGSSACVGQSWDLAGDWNPPANPNGAWSYGDYETNLFVSAPYLVEFGVYAPPIQTDGYIYKNLTGSAAFGIAPGQISLQADGGSPVARWTAPASGLYDISVMIGGTTAVEGSGYGNNFAQFAGLNINMVGQPENSFTDNVKSWTFSNIGLSAGTTVDAYVAWPGHANGGNTQTIFHVDAVPTPLLTIFYTNSSVIVSWPSSVAVWTLQTNGNLTTTNWGNYGGTTNTSNGTNSITVTPPTGNLFFRLANP